MNKNIKFILINSSFLLIIFAFYINQIFSIVQDKESIENRSKIEKPEFDINRLDYFPSEFENYYTDNFSLRNTFLSKFNEFNKNVFNNHIISGRYIRGRDGYIFPLIRYKQLYKTFEEAHLAVIKNELEYRDSVFKSENIKMMIFVIPTKISACYEKLPVFFKVNKQSRSEQFNEYLNKNSDLEIYLLNDFLNVKKDSTDIFFKFDTHWNKLGAYWAYYFVSEKIRNYFPQVETLNLSDFIITDTLRPNGDIAKNLGLDLVDIQLVFTPVNKSAAKTIPSKKKYKSSEIFSWGLKTSVIDNKNLPTALIIRDSYVQHNFEFLINIFGESLFVWDKWKYKPHYDIVADLDTDFVIYLMSEGNLHRFLPDDISKQYDK